MMFKRILFLFSILILLTTFACKTIPELPAQPEQSEPIAGIQDSDIPATDDEDLVDIDLEHKDDDEPETQAEETTPEQTAPSIRFMVEFTDERMNHYCRPLPLANAHDYAITDDELYITFSDNPGTLYEIDLDDFERKQIARSEYPNGIITNILADDDWVFYIDAMEPGNRFDWNAYVLDLDTLQKHAITEPERTEKAIELRSFALEDDVLYFNVLTQNENQEGFQKSAIVAFDLEDGAYSTLLSTDSGDAVFTRLVVSDDLLVAEKSSLQKEKGVELYIYDLEDHDLSILSPADYVGFLSADEPWISWANTTGGLSLYNAETGAQRNLTESPIDFLDASMTLHDDFALGYYTVQAGNGGWVIVFYDLDGARFLSLGREGLEYRVINPIVDSDELHWFLENVSLNAGPDVYHCEVEIDELESWAGMP